MKAVILAAGLGKRLQPIIGDDIPKVMVRYGDKPLLQRTIEILRERGIKEIVIVVNYQKEKIIEHFGDGSKFGVNIEYVLQENPKGGTADAVRYVKDKIDGEKFLLIYGDNIFHENTIADLLSAGEKFDGVMCGKEVENISNFGALEVENGLVLKIHEKSENPPTNIANSGLFILPKEIFSAIDQTTLSPRGEYELTDSIQLLINSGRKIGFVKINDFWIDPGNEDDINKANEILKW